MRQSIWAAASIFGLVGFAAAAATPAFAQSKEAEANSSTDIVVTAQRRDEKQVDVPITITAISSQALTNANVRQMSDIGKLTPALRFDSTSAFTQPTIRGVGTPVVTSGGGTNVGIYVDGFYSPNPLANDFQFLTVQSVQVLKGPQGTLFGHNTTGGAITVQTADPSTITKLLGKVSYGRFNDFRAQAYATTGLTEDIALDIEGLYARGDGFLTNVVDGNKKVGKYADYTVRAGIKAQVTSNISVLLRYTHAHVNNPTSVLTASLLDPVFGSGVSFAAQNGGYFFNPDFSTRPSGCTVASPCFTYNPRETAMGVGVGEALLVRADSDVIQATIKADLGFANLTSYTQYRKEKVDQRLAADYSGSSLAVVGLPSTVTTWSQEVLLNSKPGPKLQWTAGLFYFSNKDPFRVVIHASNKYGGPPLPLTTFGGSGTTTKGYAAFADVTYELTEKLFLTAGARVSRDEVTDAYWNTQFLAPSYTKADGTVVSAPNGIVAQPNIHSTHFTPRMVIRYKPDDHSSIYASFSQGYKAAIIDVGGSCQNPTSNFGVPAYTCNPIKPEKIDAYEIGYKYDNRRFAFDLSAFYYNYKNLQVSVYLAGQHAFILNAANSRIYGIDGQISAKLNDHFSAQAAAAWTHARFVSFNQAPVFSNNGGGFFSVPPGTTLTNSTMARTPEFSGNVSLRYQNDLAGGKLALSSGLNFTSKIYLGPSGNQFAQNGYATLDARAQWTDPSDHYTLAVFGNNLTNQAYKTALQYQTAGFGANWAKPVSYGIEVGVKF